MPQHPTSFPSSSSPCTTSLPSMASHFCLIYPYILNRNANLCLLLSCPSPPKTPYIYSTTPS
uniref:Uncharacterized protein n=1 Tax=Rhizophora mucronata TaxID=61149 RepID=A0A2P2PQX0_RHIMU